MKDQDYDIPELPEEDRIGSRHSLLKHVEPDLTREEHKKTEKHHETNHSTHSTDTHSVHLTHHTTHSNHHPVAEKSNPKHHEQNTISEKVLRITCIIAFILWFITVLILSIITGDSPFLTFIGLSPLLLTIIVSYVLVDRYHMESGFLMVFPFIFTGIFLVLGVATLLGGMDYLTLCVVNIVLGLLFEAVLVVQHTFVVNEHEENHKKEKEPVHHETKHEVVEEVVHEKTVEKVVEKKVEKAKVELEDDEGVDRFVASIEDKAKAINAVIGRVYSVRKGGTESMRKLIRIDPAHYNEFNLLKDKQTDKRKHAAARILWKIRKTLLLLQQKEVNVFDKQDLDRAFKLDREPYGHDKVLDVLVRNDSDPVKTYYEGALQFCESAMSDLGYSEKQGEEDDKHEHKHFFESLKFN